MLECINNLAARINRGAMNRSDLQRLLETVDITRQYLNRLLESATGLTSVSLCLCGRDLFHWAETERKHFCLRHARRICPSLAEKCQECDKKNIEGATQPLQELDYACDPLGLQEFIIPIKFQDEIILYLFGGGVLLEGNRREVVCDRIIKKGCLIGRNEVMELLETDLPICSRADWYNFKALGRSLGKLLEQIIETRWKTRKLQDINSLGKLGRNILGGGTGGEINPLSELSRFAEAFQEKVNCDACCIWRIDKNRVIPIVTSGFTNPSMMELAALNPQESLFAGYITASRPHVVTDLQEQTDLQSDPALSVPFKAGFRAIQTIPLPHPPCFQAISVYRRKLFGFRNYEIDHIRELSFLVLDVMEKVQLFRTTLAIGEITSFLNRAEDSDDLYDQLTQKIATWLGARGCSIFFRRERSQVFELRGTTGVKDRNEAHYHAGEGLTGWVAKEGKTLRIFNCNDMDECRARHPGVQWTHKVTERIECNLGPKAVRSFLASPIRIGDDVVGVVRVYCTKIGRSVFDAEDELLLDAIAQHLAFSWQRFRLLTSRTEALERMKVDFSHILEVHDAVARGKTLEQVVELACTKILEKRPTWKWADLRVSDEEQTYLYYLAFVGPGKDQAKDFHFPLDGDCSLGTEAYCSQKSKYVPDIQKEEKYTFSCDAMRDNVKSCYVHPIPISHDRWGVLSIDSVKIDDFDRDSLLYIDLVASQLSVALTYASSIKTLKDAEIDKRMHLEGLSHQVISPLFAIRCHCENILSQKIRPERGKIVLQAIASQAQIASRCAENFMQLSDILIGRVPPSGIQKSKRNIVKLLIQIASDYQPMAWQNHIKIKVNEESFGKTLEIPYDERSFPHVINNLIANAVKYSHPYTDILIKGKITADKLDIIVINTGIWLTSKEATIIFDHGYRSQEARIRNVPGTGIGLTIAKSIVEAHKGKIWAVPTNKKGETALIVRMPLTV